jgi:hypothetical protein
MRIAFPTAFAAGTLLMSLVASAAGAGTATRAWVSGHGTDAVGCGAPTLPCRSLQYTHDNIVAAGGEIDILDPAGYGAITIDKALSIVNDGVGTAGVQATAGSAITIMAGPTDAIYLRGLNIDGVNKSGDEGVILNSGRRLTIIGCVVQHFGDDGILVDSSAAADVFISNTVAAENNSFGILFSEGGGTISGVVNAVEAFENGDSGVGVNTEGATGHSTLTISHVIAALNGSDGMLATGNPSGAPNLSVDIDQSYLNSNTADGLAANGGVLAHLSQTTIDQNKGFGVDNSVSASGAVYTSHDNHIDQNIGADVNGTALQAQPPQ